MTSLRRFALVALLLSLAGTVVTAQNNPALFNVKKIYVEKMDNNLDQYITSEISRQFHGSLTVVLSPREADAIIKGVNVGAQNTTQATIQLVDRSGKVVLWSGTGNDRNKLFLDIKHSGEPKVAAHLVKELKQSMQPK